MSLQENKTNSQQPVISNENNLKQSLQATEVHLQLNIFILKSQYS